MDFVPLLVIGALLLVMVYFSNRSKAKRTAADAERRQSMVPGTRVMTTAGLHGTITAIDPDNDGGQADTVTLEVAPGVSLTWALAAVREAPQRVAAVLPPESTGTTGTTGTSETIETIETIDPTAGVTRSTAGGPVRMVKPKGRGGEA